MISVDQIKSFKDLAVLQALMPASPSCSSEQWANPNVCSFAWFHMSASEYGCETSHRIDGEVSEPFKYKDRFPGIILCICPTNERQCYNGTPSLIGWVNTQNDPWSSQVYIPMTKIRQSWDHLIRWSWDSLIFMQTFSTVNSTNLGLYSLSGLMSYRKILWSLEAPRLDVIMMISISNLPGILAAQLPRCLANFRVIGKV